MIDYNFEAAADIAERAYELLSGIAGHAELYSQRSELSPACYFMIQHDREAVDAMIDEVKANRPAFAVIFARAESSKLPHELARAKDLIESMAKTSKQQWERDPPLVAAEEYVYRNRHREALSHCRHIAEADEAARNQTTQPRPANGAHLTGDAPSFRGVPTGCRP